MTILFAGAEDSEIRLVGDVAITTDSGTFRSQYARCAVNVGTTNFSVAGAMSFGQAGPFVPASDLWVWARCRRRGGVNAVILQSVVVMELGFGGLPFLRLVDTSSAGTSPVMTWQVRTASSTWTQIGDPMTAIDTGAIVRVDVHAVIHASAGEIRTYLGEALVSEITGVDTKGINPGTTIDFVRFGSHAYNTTNTSAYTAWSEIIVADETTQKWSGVYTLFPNGDGFHNDLAGDYTRVDEIVLDDNDALVGDTAGQRTTMAFSDLPPSDTENVAAVVLSQRHSHDTSAPGSLIGLWRISSTTYEHPDSIAHGPGLGPVQHVWLLSPATSQPITRDEVNNGQFGPEIDG